VEEFHWEKIQSPAGLANWIFSFSVAPGAEIWILTIRTGSDQSFVAIIVADSFLLVFYGVLLGRHFILFFQNDNMC